VKAITETPTPPPEHTVQRARALPNHHLHLASPWTASRMHGDKAVIVTPQGEHRFDFVIFGTGFDMDIGKHPELACLLPHMLLWKDRFDAPPAEGNDMLSRLHYLGPACEFNEHTPGACPVLGRISLLGAAASLPSTTCFPPRFAPRNLAAPPARLTADYRNAKHADFPDAR
jgi:hypothetical protein